jgi:hypothetical protein
MLFSAILGSVFGIMSAIGGVLELVESRIVALKRVQLRKQKLRKNLYTMSELVSHRLSKGPLMTTDQIEELASKTSSVRDFSTIEGLHSDRTDFMLASPLDY